MEIQNAVLEANKFKEFNEMQKKCLNKLDNNLVVSAPTASGKTIIAELFMLEQVIKHKKKVIYTCPLRALAGEHYKDFKKKYKGISFSISTGDMDSSSSYLKKFDVIFTTYEKLASLLRHKAQWLDNVGCLIVDEIHELDSDRGTVLEIAITQMRNKSPNLKVLGLSATISNAKELAEWLEAELVESNYRPTILKEGIAFEKEIEFNDGQIIENNVEEFIEKNLENKKQFLFFLNSRKRAEGQAKKLRSKSEKVLSENETQKLLELSEKILDVLEQPTEQCSSLAECVKKGSAFHHAGLMPRQKELVENNFKNGLIKSICSTTTLSAGINLPADIVVIPSLYRYGNWGMELIPVREYKQCSGRSGRPRFSTEGRSIIIAGNKNQKELYKEKYINGEIEPINSKLSNESLLRMHLLGLIASEEINNDKGIWGFFEKTLYAKQQGSVADIFEKVLNIVQYLEEKGFVEKKENYFMATKIGKRVSDLFLDPESASFLIESLQSEKMFSDFSYLFAWTKCYEFYPLFNAPKRIEPFILEEFNSRMNELPFKENDLLFDNNSLNSFYSAMLLEKWINEVHEQELFKDFNLSPGVLFGKTRILDWLSYATIELAKILEKEEHVIPSKKIGKRIKYGVKEELLALVELKGIGRVRARRLFRAGIKSPSEVKKNFFKVEKILGKMVSENIKKELQISYKQ